MECGPATASVRVGVNSALLGRCGAGECFVECGGMRHLGSLRNNCDLLGLSLRTGGVKAKCLGSSTVTAEKKKDKTSEWNYPWPKKITPEMEKDSLKLLNRFQPLPVKPKFVTLPFEKPIVEIEKKIEEVREMANKTGMDFTAQINELEEKYHQVRKDLYSDLTSMQRLSLARHPNRPTFMDHIMNMTDKWIELHGDRAGHDDPAIVTGIGMMEGMSFMFIGQQKGRNTKENIYRNFGMPQPYGYRKALRQMLHADRFGFPILTFVDTPGAYAGVAAEELGQGEAIAQNLRSMFGLRVPIITTVIGEGGSGGALAIGCGNKMLMLENSVYYVASPEACAAILWKTPEAVPQAADALRITAKELQNFGIVDEIIPEPLGGAQYDPVTTSKNMKTVILKHMEELLRMDDKSVMAHRRAKFRSIGEFEENVEIDPYIKRNMKARDIGDVVVVGVDHLKQLPAAASTESFDGALLSNAAAAAAIDDDGAAAALINHSNNNSAAESVVSRH